jgi:6-phosphogluconolactonase
MAKLDGQRERARRGRSGVDVQVHATAEAASRAGAESFVEHARRAIAARGRFDVALSGGDTPRRMYEMLAEEPLASRVDWARVHVFWGDERGVPPHHERSNYRMANLAFVSRVPIPAANVHRMRGEIAADEAATHYERELIAHFAAGEGGVVFDLVHLGIGDDGHTASLFPDTRELEERARSVIATVDRSHDDEPRITVTFRVIDAARRVELLVLEAGKASVVRRVIEGGEPPARLPAIAIDPRGELAWILTEGAAQEVRP